MVHEQVHTAGLAVQLARGDIHVRSHLSHAALAEGEHYQRIIKALGAV